MSHNRSQEVKENVTISFLGKFYNGFLSNVSMESDGEEIIAGILRRASDSFFGLDLGDSKEISMTGKDLIKRIGTGGNAVNVIPGGVPGGCHSVLVAAIGSRESVENRIYQAIEHTGAKCRAITKNVVFVALKWNQSTWLKHKASFANLGVHVFLIMAPSYEVKLL